MTELLYPTVDISHAFLSRTHDMTKFPVRCLNIPLLSGPETTRAEILNNIIRIPRALVIFLISKGTHYIRYRPIYSNFIYERRKRVFWVMTHHSHYHKLLISARLSVIHMGGHSWRWRFLFNRTFRIMLERNRATFKAVISNVYVETRYKTGRKSLCDTTSFVIYKHF